MEGSNALVVGSTDTSFEITTPLCISFLCIMITTAFWYFYQYRCRIAIEKKKKEALVRSRIEEYRKRVDDYAERERQRRRELEESVQLAEEVKLLKQQEIERLEAVRLQEELNIRLRQEEAMEKAEIKRKEEERVRQEEKEAVKKANKEGALCLFSDAAGVLTDVELRIPLIDAVGFVTTISHVKSCLRAHYHGNPSESLQKIIYDGRVLLDSEKLRDLFSLLPLKSKPIMFHVAVSKRKVTADTSNQSGVAKAEVPGMQQQTTTEADKTTAAAACPETTSAAQPDGQVKVTVKGDKPFQISMSASTPVSVLRSAFASECDRPAETVRFVYGGRVLKPDETLFDVLLHCRDKSCLTVHVLISAAAEAIRPTSTHEGMQEGEQVGSEKSCDGAAQTVGAETSAQQGASTPTDHVPAAGEASPQATRTPIRRREEEMLEVLRKRLESSMRQAFWDRLDETLRSDSPDYEWICRLYSELGDRLCALTPRRADIVEETRAALDVDLFSGMVRNQAFDLEDLRRLVAFAFGRLLTLCSPARDDELTRSRDDLVKLLDGGGAGLTFATFVVPFLRAFHQALDDIEADIAAYRAAQSASASPTATPGRSARSPSPGEPGATSRMSVDAVRARLEELGVPPETVRSCVERRQLDALLGDALRRQQLAANAVVNNAPTVAPASAQGLSGAAAADGSKMGINGASAAAGAAKIPGVVTVIFKVGMGAAATVVELALARDASVAEARKALSDALRNRPAPSRIQLVHAGRVLRDSDNLHAVFAPSETEAVVHVVISKAVAATAASHPTASSPSAAAAASPPAALQDSAAGAALANGSEGELEVTFRSRQVVRRNATHLPARGLEAPSSNDEGQSKWSNPLPSPRCQTRPMQRAGDRCKATSAPPKEASGMRP